MKANCAACGIEFEERRRRITCGEACSESHRRAMKKGENRRYRERYRDLDLERKRQYRAANPRKQLEWKNRHRALHPEKKRGEDRLRYATRRAASLLGIPPLLYAVLRARGVEVPA